MIVIAFLRSARVIVVMSVPSTNIVPDSSSFILKSYTMQSTVVSKRVPERDCRFVRTAARHVDFPQPLLPTIPTRVPPLTLKVRSFRAGGRSGLYFRTTFWKRTEPAVIQWEGPFLSTTFFGSDGDSRLSSRKGDVSSLGSSMVSWTLDSATRHVSNYGDHSDSDDRSKGRDWTTYLCSHNDSVL